LHGDDLKSEDDVVAMIGWINLKADEGYTLMQPIAVKGHLFLFMKLEED
jgi:hypothetical protein